MNDVYSTEDLITYLKQVKANFKVYEPNGLKLVYIFRQPTKVERIMNGDYIPQIRVSDDESEPGAYIRDNGWCYSTPWDDVIPMLKKDGFI